MDDLMGNSVDDPIERPDEGSAFPPAPKKRGPKPGSTYRKKVVSVDALTQTLRAQPDHPKRIGRPPKEQNGAPLKKRIGRPPKTPTAPSLPASPGPALCENPVLQALGEEWEALEGQIAALQAKQAWLKEITAKAQAIHEGRAEG